MKLVRHKTRTSRITSLAIFLFCAAIILFHSASFVFALDSSPASNTIQRVQLTPQERDWLAVHPDIQLGYTDVFEPEVIANPDGSYSGILVDFLEELNQRLGTRIGLRIDPLSELLRKTQAKEVDGILEIHPEYADKLGLLKSDGYLTGYPAVFARRNISFEGPEDFAGKRVAIIDKVYFSEKMLQQYGKQATILKVKDALEGIKSVSKGEADLFIGVSFNSYYITKFHLFDVVSKYIFEDYPDRFGVAVRPDWPELVSILNKGISSFSQNELDTIVARWVQMPHQEKTVELTSEEQAWLQKNPAIQVALFPAVPYMFEKDGKSYGYLVELFSAICQQSGLKKDFTMQPLAEALKKVEDQQAHAVLGVIHTKERSRFRELSAKTRAMPMGVFWRAEVSD
ncbi:MAG: transporter substrate-binding domain-containing protein, partial [Desulfuromusa sp.]|nr:transporter substrate-binding domain-containing protein [Desulfuromusa sp.]